MESSGMYTSSMGSGMLGLEMSLHPHIPQQQQRQQQPPHHMVVPYDQQQPQVQYQQFPAKPKNQNLTLSDDDEVGNLTADNSVVDDGKRQISPWHRMKWTDNMVRLLIMVVYYIGDEGGGGGGSEGNGNDPSGKKRGGGGGGGGGILQKKGKWKSVSKAMMERGFFVSPQQCEDKFNDLNKRYKRVNDILGKGTACKVVENQSLLDSMHHLSTKLKEEVKKLLNSKHLFFREMCAYHNSCNHGGGNGGGSSSAGNGGGAGVQNSPEVAVEPTQAQQQTCLHSNGSKMVKDQASSEDGDNDEDNDDVEDDEEDEDVVENGGRTHDHDDRKRRRKGVPVSPLIQQLGSELMNVIQDGTKSASQKRSWMRTKMMQLEEERVSYQSQAFELEKQRLKWEKFSSKKEREMEKERLSNERMRLENERMVLLIRRKEMELLDLH